MTQIDLAACPLQLDMQPVSDTISSLSITIPAPIVDALYHQALQAQQQQVHAPGFARGTVPLDYIAHNFKTSITQHLKEFLCNYFVTSFLYNQLRTKKIVIAGDPRLQSMHVEPHQDAQFKFEVNIYPELEIQEWKHLPFKAPKRKKYKDLDRQVDTFIKEEVQQFNNHGDPIAHNGDWVNFDLTILNAQGHPLFINHQENVWLRLADEEADKLLRDLFIDKKVGDTFSTNIRSLQMFFSEQLETNYTFAITITDILHNAYFCLEQFKKFFKLKTNKEVYQKLIEVFSYRNDLSQRRSMAEESLKLLMSRHRLDIPKHLILRQQKKVLDAVQTNPDYHVYRMQKDFKKRVKQLAEKQTQELLLLDHIAHLEDITVTNHDAKQYLNLTQRPRTKEFIYLVPPSTKLYGIEAPISSEELKMACLREKTLNHIIYHLTKA